MMLTLYVKAQATKPRESETDGSWESAKLLGLPDDFDSRIHRSNA